MAHRNFVRGSRSLPSVRAPKEKINKWHIVREDLVQVIGGKEKGKQGKVIRVDRKHNRLYLQGINLVKRRIKETENNEASYFFKEAPIHYSNVMLIDPSTGKPTRIKTQFAEDGTKLRVSKATGTIIPKSPKLAEKKFTSKEGAQGPKDTAPEDVLEKTFDELSLVPILTEEKIARIWHKIKEDRRIKEEAEILLTRSQERLYLRKLKQQLSGTEEAPGLGMEEGEEEAQEDGALDASTVKERTVA
ncbi:39S ribosomal protein L24, mitochondrial [Balamuthia mandrillaris]